MAGRAISAEHEDLGDTVARMLESSGFTVDREVQVEVDSNSQLPEKFTHDVCAIYNDAMVVVETKTGGLKFKDLILSQTKRKEKLKNFGGTRVISSRRKRIRTTKIRSLTCMAVTLVGTGDEPGPEYTKQLRAAGLHFWSRQTLQYYVDTVRSLGNWTKFEILHDLELEPKETRTLMEIPAIRVTQPGGSAYLCAMKPWDLLRIAYVHRRSKLETMAYQRIVKRKKLESMSAFLHKPEAMLPNNIIITIDEGFSNQVKYDEKSGLLTLPGKFCSAWVVDGQHRLYGFTDTKYGKGENLGKFEVPVVVFDKLSPKNQTAMFVDINSNQKRIDSTLLADLSTILKDLSRKETWPSMLGWRLNQGGPFKGLVRIFEIKVEGETKPITLAGLSKYALTKYLLAPKMVKGEISGYAGSLYHAAEFDWRLSMDNPVNRDALDKQVAILNEYFSVVRSLLGRKWDKAEVYGVTSYPVVNALLMVLNKILETGKSLEELRLSEFLKPIADAKIRWTRKATRKYSNYAGFIELANRLISTLNSRNKIKLEPYQSLGSASV